MIDPTFKNSDRLLVLSFKAGDNDPTRNSLDNYYMPLVEIKDNKPFFHQTVKTNKKRMKNLPNYLETLTIQQETY